MNLNKLILIIVTFLFNLYQSDSLLAQVNTEYVENLSDGFTAKTFLKIKSHRFMINDELNDLEIKYKPNANITSGFGFNYRWLGLAVAFKAPYLNSDNDKYGNTKQFDIQANIYSSNFVFDINLIHYQGFYLENVEELYNIDDIKEYPTREDITSSTIGGSFYYIANGDEFSYKAAYIQNEVQKKSAGSLIIGSFISIYGMQADSSIVPFEFRDSVQAETNFKAASSLNFGASLGYVHTFVTMDDFFLTFGFVPGIGLQGFSRELENGEIIDSELGGMIKLHLRMAFGYSREKHFGSITFVNDSYVIGEEDKLLLNYGFGSLKLTFGLRF